jgi:hypothetical protein
MDNLFTPIRVLYGEVIARCIDVRDIDGPTLVGICFALLESNKLSKIIVIEGIRFAEITARIKLVVPNLLGGFSFFKEEDDGFNSGPLERASWAIQDGVKLAAFEQELPKSYRSVIAVR